MTSHNKIRKARPTRFIAVYGFEVFSFGLQYAIQGSGVLEHLGSFNNSDELSFELLKHTDIVVIQIDLSKENGFELCFRLSMQKPDIATLLLTTQDLDLFYATANAVNARGLLLYQDSVEHIVEQIRRAVDGPVFSTTQLLRIKKWQTTVGAQLRKLSPREWEVFLLVAEGYKNREISSSLEVSKNTVERHLSNLMDKLGVRSRTMVLNYYYNNHLHALDSLIRNKQSRLRLFSWTGPDDFNNSPVENPPQRL